jgi:NACHT domain
LRKFKSVAGAILVISIDEVATGLLINAVSAAGRWLGTAIGAARSGRGQLPEDLAIAGWFETYKLTDRTPPDVSRMSVEVTTRLTECLRGNDVQAAVQELLAVRLTDGPNADAARARDAFVLTLASTGDPEISGYAETLANYYDDEISDLVGRLGDTPMLSQIRAEGLSNRMIAVLHAIERHTAALSSRPTLRTETDFLTRYQAHVLDQHGKLEPPDFERRRRVPIGDIYVSTMIYEKKHPEQGRLALAVQPPSTYIDVWGLATLIDRSVLLGDPGGGKTTASTVLMHHFATDDGRRVPFLVTLRNFAAGGVPTRSVVGYIEHELETFYQCPAPPGLVDLLLLTGRAVVLFDGLDELLDTSRRVDIAARVERFCTEYPLAPVLVTSRVVGYDQAHLDESQFTSYRLGGFRDKDVADYVRKWFALDDGAQPDDAAAFLAESESIPDLRSNPLLLSLMCILYRGEGSLPRNRAEVYEHCSNLLFRRWDARRRIHHELRAGHLLEPTLRHLAWWLFIRADTQAAVTERELVSVTTEFLHGRGFESLHDASEAAHEFVEFSRGRMWVFSDHGTSASGEKLYAFTHRTFLEYFAAAQLAFDSDTPTKLAKKLLPRVASGEWEVVGELAVQIKSQTSTDGAMRIYEYMLDDRRSRSPEGNSNLLQFLTLTLRSVDPSPRLIRLLSKKVLQFFFSGDLNSNVYYLPVFLLMGNCGWHTAIVSAEVDEIIASMIESDNLAKRLSAIRFIISMNSALYLIFTNHQPTLSSSDRSVAFWRDKSLQNMRKYRAIIVALAISRESIRVEAMQNGLITVDEALDMQGGVRPLLRPQRPGAFDTRHSALLCVYFQWLIWNISDESVRIASEYLSAVGRHVSRTESPPWTYGTIKPWLSLMWDKNHSDRVESLPLDPFTYLGGAIVALTCSEGPTDWGLNILSKDSALLGPFSNLYAYIGHRQLGGGFSSAQALPDLPVHEPFKQMFRDWADRKVDFIAGASASSTSSG